MPPLFHALRAAACGALMGTAVRAAETLPQTSPFVPATASASNPAAVAESHELAAISIIGKKTTVNIYDKTAKKGRWIAVGETVDGINVVSFDPARERVVVRIGASAEKVLSLRHASASAATAAAPSAPWAPPAGFIAPNTPAATTASEPVVIAPAAAVAPATPSTPPAPGSIAHQEQEARMLVSDLLEIGMAQRKAYEEAQRKAAETAQTGTPRPAPAPIAPAKPAKP